MYFFPFCHFCHSFSNQNDFHPFGIEIEIILKKIYWKKKSFCILPMMIDLVIDRIESIFMSTFYLNSFCWFIDSYQFVLSSVRVLCTLFVSLFSTILFHITFESKYIRFHAVSRHFGFLIMICEHNLWAMCVCMCVCMT